MANTMDKLRELGERMVARSQHCENTKDGIAMQEHAAELSAILRESEAQVPVAATLDEEAELTEQVQARVAELEADARRWRKCKRMRKSWWLAALTEAGMMYGRSLDEQIDEQPDAPADFME